jgi:hypothetical protein
MKKDIESGVFKKEHPNVVIKIRKLLTFLE